MWLNVWINTWSSPGPFWRGGGNSLQWARASSFTRFLDHTRLRTTVGRTPRDEWSARRRDLYLTTQYLQETDIHAPDGIRTHSQSRRAESDSRLRPRGDWDHPRPFKYIKTKFTFASMILWGLIEISFVDVMRYLPIRVFKNKIYVAFSIKSWVLLLVVFIDSGIFLCAVWWYVKRICWYVDTGRFI